MYAVLTLHACSFDKHHYYEILQEKPNDLM
jgi:hypothetical protein